MECWRWGVGWSERERGLFSSDIAKLVAIIHRYKRYEWSGGGGIGWSVGGGG